MDKKTLEMYPGLTTQNMEEGFSEPEFVPLPKLLPIEDKDIPEVIYGVKIRKSAEIDLSDLGKFKTVEVNFDNPGKFTTQYLQTKGESKENIFSK